MINQGLGCDECGYTRPVERLHRGLIGSRCPSCNAVMLTERDYRTARRVLFRTKLAIALSVLMRMFGARGELRVKISVKDGKATVERRD